MSKYTPVPAIMPAVALATQRASQGLDSLPTNAATVIMFGRPGLAGRGVPGLFGNYSRQRREPAPPPHPTYLRERIAS